MLRVSGSRRRSPAGHWGYNGLRSERCTRSRPRGPTLGPPHALEISQVRDAGEETDHPGDVHVRDILLEDGEARKHHSVVGTTREFFHEPVGGYKEGRKSL